MKRRVIRVVNFFTFNLLFFSLYLTLINKEKKSLAFFPAFRYAAHSNLELVKKNETLKNDREKQDKERSSIK